jgi:hypothetical protein
MAVKRTIEAAVPAAAAGATQDQVIGRAPFSGRVSAVSVIPEAAVTADGTNFRTIRVINKGQGGAGSTVAASLALDTPGTDDLAAFDEKAVPVAAAAADRAVAAGDVLAVDESVAGTGLAHSGYRVLVEISRD